MKNLLTLCTLALLLAVLGSACQKDEQNAEPQQSYESSFSKIENLEQSFPVKKGLFRKPGFVYVVKIEGDTLLKHKTMKFRSADWSFIQEWFIEDLKTGYIPDYAFYPGDNSGLVHGYYYPWYQLTNLQDNLGESWTDLIMTDSVSFIPATGFHIPRGERTIGDGTDDILQLAKGLGSTSLVRSALDLQYDNYINGEGQYFYSTDTSPSMATCAYIWIDRRNSYNSSNIVPRCGVSALWYKNQNDQYANGFGNDPRGRMNVRLVRSLTRSQW